jgi:hypothetical protein
LSNNIKTALHGFVILRTVGVKLGLILREERKAEGVREQEAEWNYVFGPKMEEVGGGGRQFYT